MTYGSLAVFLLAFLIQAGRSTLVVPTKITAVDDSFRRGSSVTLKATFAAERAPVLSGACTQAGYAVRVYDASLVAQNPPRISADSTNPTARPVTPYLQQSGAPEQPRTGPNAMTIEKVFEPFRLATKRRYPARVYVGLFHICGAAKPVDIDETGTSIIYNTPLNGSYIGGTFFRCSGASAGAVCTYRPE